MGIGEWRSRRIYVGTACQPVRGKHQRFFRGRNGGSAKDEIPLVAPINYPFVGRDCLAGGDFFLCHPSVGQPRRGVVVDLLICSPCYRRGDLGICGDMEISDNQLFIRYHHYMDGVDLLLYDGDNVCEGHDGAVVYIPHRCALAGFRNFMGIFQDFTPKTKGHGRDENGRREGIGRNLTVERG